MRPGGTSRRTPGVLLVIVLSLCCVVLALRCGCSVRLAVLHSINTRMSVHSRACRNLPCSGQGWLQRARPLQGSTNARGLGKPGTAFRALAVWNTEKLNCQTYV